MAEGVLGTKGIWGSRSRSRGTTLVAQTSKPSKQTHNFPRYTLDENIILLRFSTPSIFLGLVHRRSKSREHGAFPRRI